MLTNLFKKRDLIAGLVSASVIALFAGPSAHAAFTDNLELYYDFDNDTIGAGGISDQSGNSRDGSPRDDDGSLSISTSVVGTIGYGNSLANTGGDLVLADWTGIGGGTTDRTVAMWVNLAINGNVLAEWGQNSNGQRFTFRTEDNPNQSGATAIGGLRTEIQGDYRTTSSGQPAGANGVWNHVATVYDYNTGTGLLEQVTMYVNGVAVASYNDNAAAQAINTSTANNVRIAGGDLTGSDRISSGNYDEVGIWSRALSASEIADLASGLTANTLAFTNFNDTVKSNASQTMTGVDWETASGVTANTAVTTTASNNAGYFTTGFGATGFAPDQNIENEGPWTATFEITLDTGLTGTLEAIAFDYAALTNSGTSQGTNFRPQNFDILVNGVAFDVQKQTTAVNGEISFADTAALVTGLNTIQIISSEVNGPGYNMGIDDLKFYGEVVPEPSSLALLGLGGLLITRRRRR